MVRTIAIRLMMLATLVLAMLSLPGCLKEYDPSTKSAEVRRRIERSAEAEKQISQLQKDLDAAKSEAKKADQVKNDLEAKIKMLEQSNVGLKEQVNVLEQKSHTPVAAAEEKAEKAVQLKKELRRRRHDSRKSLGEKTAQLQKEVDAAKDEARKIEQAKKDAEAKITALEQENAQLKSGRNRPSGPLENLSGPGRLRIKVKCLPPTWNRWEATITDLGQRAWDSAASICSMGRPYRWSPKMPLIRTWLGLCGSRGYLRW